VVSIAISSFAGKNQNENYELKNQGEPLIEFREIDGGKTHSLTVKNKLEETGDYQSRG